MPIEIESPEELGYQNIHINLAESSAFEFNLKKLNLDITAIRPEYTDHRGHKNLRTLIAQSGNQLSMHEVLLTGGAIMAIYLVYSALLRRGDKIAVVFPNYSANLECPNVLELNCTKIHLKIENNWKLPLDEIENLCKSGIKLLSLTTPHNPTGCIIDIHELETLKTFSDTYNTMILFDETYRDACFESSHPLLASLHPLWISVISFSKGYGLPGIRIGAVITRNKNWMEQLLAAKETIQICNSIIDEAIAYAFYKSKSYYLQSMNTQAQKNLTILKSWLNGENNIQGILPEGGLVCFVKMKIMTSDCSSFYKELFDNHGLIVGPGHWFDMDDSYMRIGFGYPGSEKLEIGLGLITNTLDKYKMT